MAVRCECCITCKTNLVCECEDCLVKARREARLAAKDVAEDVVPNR